MWETAFLWIFIVILMMGVAFNSVRIEKLEEELSRIRKEFIIAKKEVG